MFKKNCTELEVWFWMPGVLHTGEFDCAVCCTPVNLIVWCVAHQWNWLCGVLHTGEFNCTVCCTPVKFRKTQIYQRKLNQNLKYFNPIIRGPRWLILFFKNGGPKSCDTVPLTKTTIPQLSTSHLFMATINITWYAKNLTLAGVWAEFGTPVVIHC